MRALASGQLSAIGRPGLQLRGSGSSGTRFEGIAVGTGVYTAVGGTRVRITPGRLDAIAAKLPNTQIRDLHEEAIGATVGAVREAHVHGEDVVFVGEVGLEPHASIVRRFPETIAFSIGLRFSASDLVPGPDGIADLPDDFLVDHLAIVAEGQDPDARLTRLLNRAHARSSQEGTTVDKDTAEELRRQRDQALEAEKQARADLAKAETRLENTNEKLETADRARQEAEDAAQQARTEAEAANLLLQRGKAGFATTIMKLELRAGKDVDLHQRQEELLAMDLSDLDELRLELAQAAVARQTEESNHPEGPATQPGTPSQSPSPPKRLDLDEMSMEDTLRLGLVKGVL